METKRLSTIVLSLKPEIYDCLTQEELDSHIVLKNGMDRLSESDVMEIVQASIHENKGKDVSYH